MTLFQGVQRYDVGLCHVETQDKGFVLRRVQVEQSNPEEVEQAESKAEDVLTRSVPSFSFQEFFSQKHHMDIDWDCKIFQMLRDDDTYGTNKRLAFRVLDHPVSIDVSVCVCTITTMSLVDWLGKPNRLGDSCILVLHESYPRPLALRRSFRTPSARKFCAGNCKLWLNVRCVPCC